MYRTLSVSGVIQHNSRYYYVNSLVAISFPIFLKNTRENIDKNDEEKTWKILGKKKKVKNAFKSLMYR